MGDFPPEAVCRTRCPHIPVRRGRRYLYWASSTWSRPSFVLARCAKMSRMSAERSITATPSSSESTLCWEGERALSRMTMSAPAASASAFTSAALPSPIKVLGSGASLFWSTVPTQTPPAVSSRADSSSIEDSVAFSSRLRQAAFRPTSTARLIFSSVVWSVIVPPGRPPLIFSDMPRRSRRYTSGGSPFGDTIFRLCLGPGNGRDRCPGSRACGTPAPALPPENRVRSPPLRTR